MYHHPTLNFVFFIWCSWLTYMVWLRSSWNDFVVQLEGSHMTWL